MDSSSYVPLKFNVVQPSPDRLKSEDGTYEDSSDERTRLSVEIVAEGSSKLNVMT